MSNNALDYETMPDVMLAQRAAAKDGLAVRLITTRNNQRLYRAAWSIVKNHADAEDIVQEAYMKAFSTLNSYSGKASLTTWLTRIVINQSIDFLRRRNRRMDRFQRANVTDIENYKLQQSEQEDKSLLSPESSLIVQEVATRLKHAIGALPENFRTVFVLRDIEGMSVSETAEALDLKEATVKSRLFRARQSLREDLAPELQAVLSNTITFAGADCEKMTARTLTALGLTSTL